MKLWVVLISLFSSIVGAVAGISLYLYLFESAPLVSQRQTLQVGYKPTSSTGKETPASMDFKAAAYTTRLAVVHVKTTYKDNLASFKKFHQGIEGMENYGQDQFRGLGFAPFKGSGSGVLLTADGYIATNQHVVADASKVEVTLENKKTYKAVVIGTDPTTDLALLKIEGNDFPFVKYGNSDGLEIGDWVLAVGNPFDLTSTVTAGIVSAKGRNINMINDNERLAVESFIQTDAAVNPGNSGGPLVNLNGELVGINTAIASTSGTFAGYSFAVPVSLVQKVMDDLLKYGMVQRALLGISIKEISEQDAKDQQVTNFKGVVVTGVNPNSAASESKIKEGDLILNINGVAVNTVSDLQEMVARYRPGDKIKLSLIRNKKPVDVSLTLKSAEGDTKLRKKEIAPSKYLPELQAELQALTEVEKETFGLKVGVKIVSVDEGKLRESGIPEGFIITKLDKKLVRSPADVQSIIKATEGGLLVEGMLPTGEKQFFAIGW